MVSQLSLLTAVQSHDSADGVTVVDAGPPLPAIVALVDESEYVQVFAGWVTVKVWPATVTVPFRWLSVGLAAAVNDAGPLPVPDAVSTVNQLALLTAVHAHALFDAVTVVDAVPPAAATF